jgi:hypothetical protein
LRAVLELSAVAVVLCAGCGAEICLSIVQAIVIYMVNEYVIWDFENLAVHFDNDSLFLLLQAGCAHGVEGAFAPANVPFVIVEPVEIIRIDDGVFALR